MKSKNKSNMIIDITNIKYKLQGFNPESFGISLKDPVQTLETVFKMIHQDFIRTGPQAINCQCISHTHFGIFVKERSACGCGIVDKMEEAYFFQRIKADDMILELSSKYKAEFILKDYDPNTLKALSNSLESKTLEEVLIHNLKQPETVCSGCSNIKKNCKILDRIPSVYMIELIWSRVSQHPSNMLQVLKSIPTTLDLSKIYDEITPTSHTLKSVIIEAHEYYISLVRSSTGHWNLINDKLIKKIFGGTWYETVEFLVKSLFFPIAFVYEQSEGNALRDQKESFVEIERFFYMNELFPFIDLEKKFEAWICFYCYYQNLNTNADCELCNNHRVLELDDWQCSFCDFSNQSLNLVCNKCFKSRFYFYPRYNYIHFETCRGNQAEYGFCTNCDALGKCSLCSNNLYFGQSLFCSRCGDKCFIKLSRWQFSNPILCRCSKKTEICCEFCFKKLRKCLECDKLYLISLDQCSNCNYPNTPLKLCLACHKPTEIDICGECNQVFENILCIVCTNPIETPIRFICPICDEEITGTRCGTCDYIIDYHRFPCGMCRKKVERCLVCELGVILPEDTKCHICYSTIEYFK